MIEIKEEDRLFGTVTWDDLFTRQYWDIQYQRKEIPWKGEQIGHVQTRQDYPRKIGLKIIDKILQDHEDAKKWNTFEGRMNELGMTDDIKLSIEKAWVDEFKQVNKDGQIVKRLRDFVNSDVSHYEDRYRISMENIHKIIKKHILEGKK